MNVTMEKTGNVSGTIIVSIEENDYLDKVKKDLKTIGQKRQIAGFRQGKVPEGILRKMFGKQVLADVLNRETVEALYKYISDNKLKVLGEPLLNTESQEVSFDTKEYTFSFEIGLAPEIDVKLDKSLKVPFYNIAVSDEMVDGHNKSFLRRYGKQEPGDAVDETALVKGSVVELANGEALEGGIANDNTIISMEYLGETDEKAKFMGKAVGDKVVFNPKAAAKGVTTEIASMLNIEKEAAEAVENDFEFTIKEIIVLKLAEKNQEFYDEVFGADKVHNEEEYDAELRKMIAGQLRLDSNYRFTIDAQAALEKAVGEIELPEEFLKKWLVKTNEKVTAENVDEEYARMKPAAAWQLIKEVIVEQQGIKVADDDLLREAKILAVQQFAQYGMSNVPDEYVDRYAEDFLKNDDYRRRLADKAIDDKIFTAIRENADVEEKEVSADEFNKLFA